MSTDKNLNEVGKLQEVQLILPPGIGGLTVDTSDEGTVPLQSTLSPKSNSGSVTPHAPTNIFVAGIPSTWDDKKLRERFAEYGEIMSTKVVANRHFGFVMFRHANEAQNAIQATHLTKPAANSPTLLHVSIAMHDEGVDDMPNERIFIRGLPPWATRDIVRQAFAAHGAIVECTVLLNSSGQCKGAAFVQYASIDDAQRVIDNARLVKIENWDFELEVKFSETQVVRQMRLQRNRERMKSVMAQANQGVSMLPTPTHGSTLLTPHGMPPFHANMNMPLGVLPSPTAPPPFPLAFANQQSQLGGPMSGPLVPPPMFMPNTPPPQGQFMGFPAPPPPQMQLGAHMTAPMPAPLPPPFPSSGDLYFCSAPVNEETVYGLLGHRFGLLDQCKAVPGASGCVIARLKDRNFHFLVAQQLNGTVFSTGDVLQVAIIA